MNALELGLELSANDLELDLELSANALELRSMEHRRALELRRHSLELIRAPAGRRRRTFPRPRSLAAVDHGRA